MWKHTGYSVIITLSNLLNLITGMISSCTKCTKPSMWLACEIAFNLKGLWNISSLCMDRSNNLPWLNRKVTIDDFQIWAIRTDLKLSKHFQFILSLIQVDSSERLHLKVWRNKRHQAWVRNSPSVWKAVTQDLSLKCYFKDMLKLPLQSQKTPNTSFFFLNTSGDAHIGNTGVGGWLGGGGVSVHVCPCMQ